MKKITYLLLMLLFMILIGCQDDSQPNLENEKDNENGVVKSNDKRNTKASEEPEIKKIKDFDLPDKSVGFFWEGTDGSNTFYFLGTIHVGTKDMYPLRDEIEQAFLASDFYLQEYIYEDQDNSNDKMYYEGDKKLEDHISDEVLTKIKKYTISAPITFSSLNQTKPYAVSRNAIGHELSKQEINPFYGVENYLIRKMPEDMERLALEGEERVELRYSKEEADIYALEQLFNNFNETINSQVKQLALYRLGNEEKMNLKRDASQFGGDQELADQYYDNFLKSRDQNMAKKIMELSQEQQGKTFFVAVGTAHFFGDDNIIEILKEEGFEINRK